MVSTKDDQQPSRLAHAIAKQMGWYPALLSYYLPDQCSTVAVEVAPTLQSSAVLLASSCLQVTSLIVEKQVQSISMVYLTCLSHSSVATTVQD